MFSVPLISIVLTLIVNKYSFMWASLVGGAAYFLYPPLMLWWARRFKGRSREFDGPL